MTERALSSRKSFKRPLFQRSFKRPLFQRSMLCWAWLFVAAAGAAFGCAGDAAPPASDLVRLRLDFGSGVMLSSVDYLLTGPNGFRRVGTLAVGDQPNVTATFQNLPVGQGYDVVVKGTASDDASACKGEVMFTWLPR